MNTFDFTHTNDLLLAVTIQTLGMVGENSPQEVAFTLNSPLRSRDGRTYLHIASVSGYIESVKMLLSFSKVDLNIVDDQDATPLELACFVGNLEIAELLIRRGAKIPQSIKFMVDKIPKMLSKKGKQLYDEIELKKVEGFSYPTERYDLTQEYISYKEDYAHLSQLIGRNLVQNRSTGFTATPYFSILKKPIGCGKPQVLESLEVENRLIEFLGI